MKSNNHESVDMGLMVTSSSFLAPIEYVFAERTNGPSLLLYQCLRCCIS